MSAGIFFSSKLSFPLRGFWLVTKRFKVIVRYKVTLSLSLPEREIGVKMTYGPVGDAPMSIPAFKVFKTDYF